MQLTREELEEVALAVHASLYRYWRGRYRHQEAMDLAQTGIVAALEKAEKWEGKSRLATFLTIVGKRAGLDYLRKQVREERKKKIALEAILRTKRL